MGHDEAMEDQVANAGIREELILRLAERQDVETLHRFIVELAEAESFPGEVSATPRDRAKALFGERQLAEAVVAVLNGDAVGFALYYRRTARCWGEKASISKTFTSATSTEG
jgi:hypothetical protein